MSDAPPTTTPGSGSTGPPHPPEGGGRSRWAKKGVWALLDQMLFAGANFLVMVGLTRWLDERVVGAFATGFACFLLVGVFVSSIVIEPMMVFGSGKYYETRRTYLGKLTGLHLAITAAGGVLLAAAAAGCLAWGETQLALALLCLGLIQPIQLMVWNLRNASYLDSNPRPAAIGGLIYFVLVLGLLLSLHATDRLTIVTAILTMGIGSAVSIAYMVAALGIDLRAAFERRGYAEILSDHLRYGKWALPTNLTRYVPEQLPYVALPLLLATQNQGVAALTASGALKAVLNFAMPLTLFVWAFSTLALPVMVRARHSPAFGAISLKVGLLLVIPPLLCLPVLVYQGEALIETIYDGKFVEYAGLMWLVGLIPVINAIDAVLHSQLRAAERPDRLFWGSVVAATVLAVSFAPLVWWGGVKGAVIAILVGYTAHVATLAAIGGKIIRAQSLPAETTPPPPDPAGATGRPRGEAEQFPLAPS